jgi:hypothetical protein
MIENNDVTLHRTVNTNIAALDLPIHNDTTYHHVSEGNGEEGSIAPAAAMNDGDVVLDDIDIAMTPTTIVSSSRTTSSAAAEIQYVTKKDGTMELFDKEKVRDNFGIVQRYTYICIYIYMRVF